MGSQQEDRAVSQGLDDSLSGEPEPWEFWETGLVVGSIAIGATALLALGWAVERFILP